MSGSVSQGLAIKKHSFNSSMSAFRPLHCYCSFPFPPPPLCKLNYSFANSFPSSFVFSCTSLFLTTITTAIVTRLSSAGNENKLCVLVHRKIRKKARPGNLIHTHVCKQLYVFPSKLGSRHLNYFIAFLKLNNEHFPSLIITPIKHI